MNYVRFFHSLFLGSVICIPVMVVAGTEVEELEGLEDYIWVPMLVAIFALLTKTIIEKKQR
jgi:hypothetical protein